jgi:hypothetical protein
VTATFRVDTSGEPSSEFFNILLFFKKNHLNFKMAAKNLPKVFFDVAVNGKPAGRMTFKVFSLVFFISTTIFFTYKYYALALL